MDATDRRDRAGGEAVDWFARLQAGDMERAEREQFVEWLRESHVHVAEMLRVVQIHGALERFQRWVDISTGPKTDADNVVQLPSAQDAHLTERPPPGHPRRMGAGPRIFAVAATVLLIVASIVVLPLIRGQVIETDRGERREVVLADGSLLLPIFGGVAYTRTFAAMVAVEHALGLPPNAVRRLAALTVAITEDARRVSARLRLSNAETKALDSMGHRWWRLASKDEARARQLLYRLGEDPYRDRLMLAWARAGGIDNGAARWHDLATLPQRWSAPKFPLRAADFISRGIAEGPALGHVLTLAEDAWLAAGFPLEASALAAIADQTAARFTRDHRL